MDEVKVIREAKLLSYGPVLYPVNPHTSLEVRDGSEDQTTRDSS